MEFEVGKIYNRKEDLHAKYKGNPQSGISTCANFPIIFLFKSPIGKTHGYQDGWISEDVYQYTGEGKYGDMKFVRGNFSIKEHKSKGKQLHLFEKEITGSGMYRYIGEFEYLGHIFRDALDSAGNMRRAIIFQLKKLPR